DPHASGWTYVEARAADGTQAGLMLKGSAPAVGQKMVLSVELLPALRSRMQPPQTSAARSQEAERSKAPGGAGPDVVAAMFGAGTAFAPRNVDDEMDALLGRGTR